MAGMFQPEPGVAGRYIDTIVDEDGLLCDIRFHDTEKFNFAFDIVDEIAKKTPDKLAMLHVDKEGHERRFTFGDMMEYSNRAANYFRFLGIKKPPALHRRSINMFLRNHISNSLCQSGCLLHESIVAEIFQSFQGNLRGI